MCRRLERRTGCSFESNAGETLIWNEKEKKTKKVVMKWLWCDDGKCDNAIGYNEKYVDEF